MEYVTLNNGIKMPQLGYGVFQIEKNECERCVLDALNVGYRLIDTAQSYLNEEEVGSAVKKSGINRKEIFLTTKIWFEYYGYEKTRKSVLQSLDKLQTDYLDLCLLHQPLSDVFGAYRALEDLTKEGKIRSIGISNFYPSRMIDLCHFSSISPAVNQIEIHPFNQEQSAIDWHKKYNVQLEAWAPFCEGLNDTFNNPILKAIGEKYNKTVAQVILRWHIERGIVVIPKTTKLERMKENFDVFDFILSTEDMEKIAALDQKRTFFFSNTDPEKTEWFCQMVK